jgi:ParB family chromosome partitioning protein
MIKNVESVLKHLPLEKLHRGRYQPRVHFDETALQELADSIKTQGMIEPIIARKTADHYYEIIAGERRVRAAKLAGLTEAPCLIGDYTDEQAATMTVVENVQRESLNLIEEASAYKRLIDEFNCPQETIAGLIGKSRSHIANLLRLLTLTPEVQTSLQKGLLSLGHARMLVGLPPSQQVAFMETIEKKQWSVRTLEAQIREIKTLAESKCPDLQSID